MTRERFVEAYGEAWSELGSWLDDLEAGRHPDAARDLPQRYRELCGQLAMARRRLYGSDLVDSLNELALRAHQQIYRGSAPGLIGRLSRFFAVGFPQAVRRELRLVLLSTALFGGTMLLSTLATLVDPSFVYAVHGETMVQRYEEMYDPSREWGRDASADFAMFGFYIYNNVGIAFRTFATGLLGGIGAGLILVYNGLAIGTLTGHLLAIGSFETFAAFVIGHGSFELTAIVLSGAGGMCLGLSLLIPGRRLRGDALRHSVQRALPLLWGCAAMLVGAAVLEAFWSSSAQLGIALRLGVGTLLWVGVFGYFTLAGRDSKEQP